MSILLDELCCLLYEALNETEIVKYIKNWDTSFYNLIGQMQSL